MRVAVIGGGPSGLVTLKHLITAHEHFLETEPIEARLFESEADIGGVFKHRVYEDAELVSSRQLTTFSDFRVPHLPDFLSTEQYCQYLEQYCDHFKLRPHINLSTPVRVIEQWQCDAIAVCSGLHNIPNIPNVKGVEEGVEGIPMAMHSSQVNRREQFGVGKDIMILGTGETGMDIAYMAVTSDTKSVTLCHRNGFHVAPKRALNPLWFKMKSTQHETPNVPYDVGAASLFDTAYVHHIWRDSLRSWAYYDKFAKWSVWLVSGTQAGLDQWVGELPFDRHYNSKIFFNKSTKAMSYISAPYRTDSLVNKARSHIAQVPIPDTCGRVIDLAPWPDYIDEHGVVHFTENGRAEAETMRKKICRPHVLIFATGYAQEFSFLDSTYPIPKDANMRGIWKDGDETVGFIGFIRPSFGAIPPLAELQAQLWILNLLGRLPAPLKPENHYCLHHVLSSRIQCGVDHESYAYQLACDMGSAPSFTSTATRGKFRLEGPWKWEGAQKVMETEIWETIARRRFFIGT
ncbi:dimethylaniline monooxygenase [Tothia fuscella]|uniref:Dimethylaniline monooxygenase n=1 Tax=Tothia fuscella TaxID=1048955 RepID=A0A9P4U188_9PEZI|nr:dimethylaniline monooxygenase [Tothia fuscella]